MTENKIDKINYKLHLGYAYDLKKPYIDRFERAEIMKEILATKKISHKDLAKELNIAPSTLSGWLKWNTISEKEYIKLKYNGMTKSDITNMLKKTKIKDVEGMFMTNLESLSKIIDKLNKHKLKDDTITLVTDIRNKLSRIIYNNDKM